VETIAITVDDPDAVAATIEEFRSGSRALTGLELYYELERATPLLGFHLMLRQGPQNRTNSGLQQSYGDHNRLLMLAIDKLLDGDLDWYRSRLDEVGAVGDEELLTCFEAVDALQLTPDLVLALWLGGALHDCGMLLGRGSHVDVEDGVTLSRDVVRTFVPDGLHEFTYFVIRHHDYIKGVFLGEVPAGFIAHDLGRLAPELRRVALAALGVVQVAGAASLGDGRLGAFRLGIFRRCAAGDALAQPSATTRLGRLLEAVPDAAEPPAADAAARLAALDEHGSAEVERFLDGTPLHGWHRIADGLDRDDRMRLLVDLVGLWLASPAEHVVLETTDGWAHPVDLRSPAVTRTVTALNGSRLLMIGR
jgi:hypothetical protein